MKYQTQLLFHLLCVMQSHYKEIECDAFDLSLEFSSEKMSPSSSAFKTHYKNQSRSAFKNS